MLSQIKYPFDLSFRRKPESRKNKQFWTPVFTGVTALMVFYEFIKLHALVSFPIKPAASAASG